MRVAAVISRLGPPRDTGRVPSQLPRPEVHRQLRWAYRGCRGRKLPGLSWLRGPPPAPWSLCSLSSISAPSLCLTHLSRLMRSLSLSGRGQTPVPRLWTQPCHAMSGSRDLHSASVRPPGTTTGPLLSQPLWAPLPSRLGGPLHTGAARRDVCWGRVDARAGGQAPPHRLREGAWPRALSRAPRRGSAACSFLDTSHGRVSFPLGFSFLSQIFVGLIMGVSCFNDREEVNC